MAYTTPSLSPSPSGAATSAQAAPASAATPPRMEFTIPPDSKTLIERKDNVVVLRDMLGGAVLIHVDGDRDGRYDGANDVLLHIQSNYKFEITKGICRIEGKFSNVSLPFQEASLEQLGGLAVQVGAGCNPLLKNMGEDVSPSL